MTSVPRVLKQSVYIAGPMTGYVEFNYPAFHQAARVVASLGLNPVNPAGHVEGFTWVDYMRKSITQMLTCDRVVTLPGWEKSRGAVIETELAEKLLIPVTTLEQLVVESTKGWPVETSEA